MASFHTKTFTVDDDYMTPMSAWEQIVPYVPTGTIWEPFYGDGTSGDNWCELGYEVIHKAEDFFKVNHECDMIISNPPYSMKRQVFERLKELDKPFIMLCPSSMINTKYLYQTFANKIQIMIPPKRIQFIKPHQKAVNKCNFDCFYYCYKMDLHNDIVFLPR
mgnify:FL=1